MEKTILRPDTGGWAEHETAYSQGVVVESPTHKRVFISGTTSDEPDLERQTRDVLSEIESRLAEFGGDMTDIVRVRVYVTEPNLDPEDLETIHDVRREFFEPDHYPASTLIGVGGLVSERYLIEVDAEAIIPSDGWTVSTA